MDPDQTSAEFQTTHWSLVHDARGDRSHLETLLRQYWAPVYAFIRRQGYRGPDASDLTQEFLARVVIGRDMVNRADPARGRFRAFLKQALRNFLIDQHRVGRHSRGSATGPRRPLSLHGESGEVLHEPEFTDEMSREFDRQWAATLVEITLTRLEDASRREHMTHHWEAFRINVLGPALHGTDPLDLPALGAQVGVADATQLSNMLQTMKRRFRRMLREVVAETVVTPDQVEDELNDLRRYGGL